MSVYQYWRSKGYNADLLELRRQQTRYHLILSSAKPHSHHKDMCIIGQATTLHRQYQIDQETNPIRSVISKEVNKPKQSYINISYSKPLFEKEKKLNHKPSPAWALLHNKHLAASSNDQSEFNATPKPQKKIQKLDNSTKHLVESNSSHILSTKSNTPLQTHVKVNDKFKNVLAESGLNPFGYQLSSLYKFSYFHHDNH